MLLKNMLAGSLLKKRVYRSIFKTQELDYQNILTKIDFRQLLLSLFRAVSLVSEIELRSSSLRRNYWRFGKTRISKTSGDNSLVEKQYFSTKLGCFSGLNGR